MENQTLEEIYSDFIFRVYNKRPSELNPNQERDLRMTFFAGVTACNGKYMEASEMEEPQAIKHIGKTQKEILNFIQESFPNHLKN